MSFIGVRIYLGDRSLRVLRLEKDELTIGRADDADVVLASPTVSRVHALVKFVNGRLWIRDAGSRHGVYVDRKRVDVLQLERGQRVSIEGFQLEIEALSEPDETWLRLPVDVDDIDERGEVTDVGPPPPAPVVDVEVVPPPVHELVPQPAHPTPELAPEYELSLPADDDDEDADLDVAPPFSLIDAVRTASMPPLAGRADLVLEVMEFFQGDLRAVHHVAPGSELVVWLAHGEHALASFDEDGTAHVNRIPDTSFRRWLRGDTPPDSQAVQPAESRSSQVNKSQVAEVRQGDRVWIAYIAPKPPGVPEDDDLTTLSPVAQYFAAFGSASFVGHLLIFLVLLPALLFVIAAFTSGGPQYDDDVDRFAEIQLEVPETKKEEPKPTPTPKKKATPKKQVAKRAQKAPSNQTQQASTPASAGIAGAMGKLDVRFNSNAPLLAAATNMRGVRVPGGGGYKVSAVAVKGKGVMNGRPGGAFGTHDVGTLNGQLLNARGGNGGIAKRGNGKVRGTVARPPVKKVGVKGQLDQALIAAVVNKHIHEIRHCYEKQLLQDSSLAGKLVVEWVISPDGRVTAVKTKYSSLRGGAVSGCVSSRIRTWQFPKPKGGHVVVNYPFMFESVGF